MHSISHRKMLMKILNKAHVKQNISLDKFEGLLEISVLIITSPLLMMRYMLKVENIIRRCMYL